MASSLDAAMLSEMQGLDRTDYVFELTLAGTEHRFASEAVASDSKGVYLPYVRSFASIPRSVAFPSLGLQNPRSSVSVFDEGRAIQKALGGPAAGEVIGAAAKIVLRSDEVAAANHYTALNGAVKDYSLRDREWSFTVGPDNSQLTSKLKIPKLTQEDWPRISGENRGKIGQLVVGDHSTGGIAGAAGVIQTYLVDPTNNYWYASFGHLVALPNFFPSVSGVLSSDFQMKHLAINGRPYTVAEQISGTTLTIDDDLKVDAQGVDTLGDGQGALLQNPGDVLEKMLVNLAFNEYPIGSILGSNPSAPSWRWLASVGEPVNSAYFTAVDEILSFTNHRTAFVLTSDMTAMDMIGDWVRSFKVPVFWDDQLRIAPKVFDLGIRTPYQSVFVSNDPRTGPVTGETFGEERVSRLTVNWGKSEAGGGFGRSNLAANEDLDYIVDASLDMPYGKRKVI